MIFAKKKLLITTIIILFSIVFAFFIARIIVFNRIITHLKTSNNNYSLSFDRYNFVGLNGVCFNKTLITNCRNDTIFFSDTLYLKIRILPILLGKLRLNTIVADSVLIKNDSFCSQISIQKKDSSKHTDYYVKIDKFFNLINKYIPKKVKINTVVINNKKLLKQLSISNLFYYKKSFKCRVYSDAEKVSNVEGIINHSKKEYKIFIKAEKNKGSFDFLPIFDGIKYDSIYLNFKFVKTKKVYNIISSISFNGISIENQKVSDKEVKFKSTSFFINFHIKKESIEIDSTSVISINGFSFNPYVYLEKNKSHLLHLKIIHKEFEAQKLIDALPDELFDKINRMKIEGKLSYSLNCIIDFDNLDSVYLSSSLENKGIKIINYGKAFLPILNDTFTYDAYDKDVLMKKIKISETNPDYVKLENISHYLKYSVLTSEDGSFYYHKGFNEQAISQAIGENIRKKRFARGGSTITMQLVKNVFLNKNKTISRKLEEIFLTWLIENLHVVSKDRIFEVYLNVIEWGPNVYGIKEASWFYFKKRPADLNLKESIFLASIIPSPKYYRFSFEQNGKLKDCFLNYFKRVAEIMTRRNQISPSDTIGLSLDIELKGEGKKLLLSKDTTANESETLDLFLNNDDEN